ncbi:MAG: 4Fe-4S dicluster domain-containing protein [Solidesulfovibrio sp.]|uniref:4Fe-4S dicluster domain-containing protein n=1 Tax=Solidesulfovibrio sp. TaxID=2910990 RepID=UPI002B1FC4ED|nr:4Fe-4S dicluster domain-containing protein [Solidesulfovibrio sp.]MEA4856097.1 4Fe-4S dicluster domain-containing protein [Solidesulfovibrio sp.]
MIQKTVIVRPERCVGCMQCMIRCAEAHSQSKALASAIREPILAKPRIHLGVGPEGRPFPSKCRHCEPAPCQDACMPWAIRDDISPGLKIVDPTRCIGCGMCAMSCPYYVIRFYRDAAAPERPGVAVKCDGCHERVAAGGIPACVTACKTGALAFEEVNLYLKEGTNRLANAVYGVRI